MATVYLAQALGQGVHRFVAVKCIRRELARNERFVEMFLDEARIAAQIHHANVCSVLDFDAHNGTYYLVMELLSGQTLTAIQQQLRVAVLTKPDAGVFARILEGACEGLHAAHETASSSGMPLHIVHRDVSPDNLFVTYDGNVKVMDFGVAYTTDRVHDTRTGILKGKCGYLAPEVIAGQQPDRRADVWGLGVVAWELLTQRRLFDQPNDPAILRAIDEVAIPAPSTVRDGVPTLLDDVVMHALERDPARRYQTTRELGRMLNRFLVENRQIVGLAEVAEYMRQLFPEGIACARQLVRFADQVEATPPRQRAAPPSGEPATLVDAPVANQLVRKTRPERRLPQGTPPEHRVSTQPAAPVTQLLGPRTQWWARVLTVGILVMLAFVAGTLVEERFGSHASSITLEAVPTGVDSSGAVLLRVQPARTQ